MTVLLDTNILTRAAQVTHSSHGAAVDAVRALRKRKETICLVPQNLYEFWVVATRSTSENGLGLSPPEAQSEVKALRHLFPVLNDTPGILEQWQELIVRYQVRGKTGHDARLVAAMLVHSVSALLTFNTSDFVRFTEITALAPDDVLLKS